MSLMLGNNKDNNNDGQETTKITPFNLDSERETGRFDSSGNYVWTRRDVAEPSKVTDAWLDSVDEAAKASPRTAYASSVHANKSAANVDDDDDDDDEDEVDEIDLLRQVVCLLANAKETVPDALRRLGSKEVDSKENFNELTETAGKLLDAGMLEVYQMSRADFGEEIGMRFEKKSAHPPVMWEYRVEENAVNGPFAGSTMQAWRAHGYFNGSQGAEVRVVMAGSEAPSHKVVTEANGASSNAEDLLADFDSDNEDADEAKTQGRYNDNGKWVPAESIIDFRIPPSFFSSS